MRLRELRTKAGMTQGELAKKLNVSGQTILNWENDIYEPKINQLIALANIFNVSVDYLIERDTKNSEVNTVCEYLNSIPKEDFVNFIRKSLEK